MNEKTKRIAIIVGVIVVALLLFMRNSNNSSSVITSGEIPATNDLQAPIINISGRTPFVIPDFADYNSAKTLSAIGACCADCRPQSGNLPRAVTGSGITFITNRGNSGPNVYNYYKQPAIRPRGYGVIRKI